MKIEPPLHAEHELDRLAGQFEHWRQTRSHPRARIPQELWEQAVALTTAVAPSRVATHLRLGPNDLKKQIAARQPPPVEAPGESLGFVEVMPVPSWPTATAGTEIERQRTDGTRLRLHAPDSSLPLAELVRTFLETP